MKLQITLSLVASCWFTLVRSDTLPNVYKHGCVLLNQNIYCHGGASRSASSNAIDIFNDEQFYNQHVKLNVQQALSPNQASSQWQAVSSGNSDGYVVEARAGFAITQYNATNYMIVGGQGPSTANVSGLNTIAARFNADRNQWTPLGPMQAPNTATTVHSSLNSLAFGAQIAPLSSTEIFLMGGTPSNNQTVYSGWSQYVYMNATNSTLNQYGAKYGPAASSSQRLFNHAMATDVDGRVYIFGGVVTANASANDYKTYAYANMNSSSVYSNFSFVTLKTSGALPVNRQLHTITSLPTNKILLYGGFNDDNQVLNDACYIYDAASKTWAAANFTNGIGPGPRYGHAAVLVGTELLYIIGGVDSTGQARSDVSILNTTSMTWLGPDETDTNGSSSSGSASGGGLHGGAVAGVVIGVLAAVGLLAGGAFFFIKRRRQTKTRLDSTQSFTTDISKTKQYNLTYY